MALRPTVDPRWSFLWGKRASRRHPVNLRAQVVTPRTTLAGRAVDLSANGVFLALEERLLLRALASPGQGILGGLPEALGDGFRVRFPGRRAAAEASLVRVAWRPTDGERIYLGCLFDPPLGAAPLRRLGLRLEDCAPESGSEACMAQDMALQARADRPLALEVRDGAGGFLSGPLCAADGRAVSTLLPRADPTEIAAQLSRQALRVVVRDGPRELWADDAYLLALRLPSETDAVEVVLLASRPVPPPVTNLLVPRSGLVSA